MMTPEELKDLQKEVRKAKRIATERAGELHDLVEDRLPASFEEIPVIAQATYEACQVWAEINARLEAAEAAMTGTC
jgi:hypothetical protein